MITKNPDPNLKDPPQDDWRIVRKMKWQESELTNHRISWMVTFHGLLVAALAFAWDKQNKAFLVGFTLAGIIVSIWSLKFRSFQNAEFIFPCLKERS
jgi:hypothetical protein